MQSCEATAQRLLDDYDAMAQLCEEIANRSQSDCKEIAIASQPLFSLLVIAL
jgi:hypothetical protein